MKQKSLYILSIALFFHFPFYAENVKPVQALSEATREIKNRKPDFNFVSQTFETVYKDGKQVYYIINYFPEGWALISADDVAAPLLAYSCEGNYIRENQPESMMDWIAEYADQIIELQKKGNLKKNAEWERTSTGLRNSTTEKIEPFIKVNWNQGSPYNVYCPSNADGRALVGCVAVAMAQAMSVSCAPDKPNGSISYNSSIYGALGVNFDEEMPYKWNDILSGSNNRNEVARLLYHCGISVKMSYSATSSGAFTGDVPSALKQYFSYSTSVKAYSRFSNNNDWENLLQSELSAGRPVIYSGNDGTGSTGHAFDLDGYDGTSMYHVNWGWGGQNNGYYRIDNLHDQYANYTQGHQAVVGIKPVSYAPSNIRLSNNTIQEGVEAGTPVGLVTVESETVPAGGYDYELKGPFNIFLDDYLPARFYVENDILKSKEVFTYSESESTQTVYIKAINRDNGLSFEKMFNIMVIRNTGLITLQSVPDIYIMDKNVYISTNKPCNCVLYTLTGQKTDEMTLPAGNHLLNLASKYGCYILVIRDNDIIYYTKKIFL